MGLYILKFGFRRFLAPLLALCKNVNPDIISYLALVVSLFTGIFFYSSQNNPSLLLWAIGLILLRMVLNTLDGMIAIEQKKSSPQGEIVNALPDRYSDIFTVAGIVFLPDINIYLGVFALVSVLLVSYTGMLAKAIGLNWQHQGPLGKVERLISIMLFSLGQFFSYKLNLSLNIIKGALQEIKKQHV